jgi:hypothetical protein
MDKMPFRYPKIAIPTQSLIVVDLSSDRMDGQIAACVLQGIVNRQREQKIYVTNTYCFDNKRSLFLEQAQMAEPFLSLLYSDVPVERLHKKDNPNWPGLYALLEQFSGLVKGVIIWDPALEAATIEAATTIAGQTDGLPVSPELAAALTDRNLPVIVDLREQNFRRDAECLEWLLANWFEHADHSVAFTWSHMTTDAESWGAANKDYVVANGLFTFYLDIVDEQERSCYLNVLKHYPPGTPVMGWTDEHFSDPFFQSVGYFMVPYISVENMSVHSSFPSTTGRQLDPQPMEIDPDGVYAAFYIADGDNLLHTFCYHPYTILNSPVYGKIPITWVINPGIIDLAPRLFDWYLSRLENQELAAMMGDGLPGSDRAEGFKAFCQMTASYLQRAGMHSLKVMAESEAVAWNVQPDVVNSGYDGPTDGRGIGPYEYHLDGETFHIGNVSAISWEDWWQELGPLHPEQVREVVRGAPPGQPLFLNIFCGTCNMDQFGGEHPRDAVAVINRMADILRAYGEQDGKHYYYVRSMDVAATYRKYM